MLGLSQEVSDRTETSPKVSVNPLLAHHDSLGSTLILFESSRTLDISTLGTIHH